MTNLNINKKESINFPVVSLTNITLTQENKQLFKTTNWTIFRKQHWAIVGNGSSGSSTLAKILSSSIRVSSGKVLYFLDSKNPQQGRGYFEPGKVIRVGLDSYSTMMRKYAGYQQARWQSFEGKDCPTASEILTGLSIENRSEYHVEPQRIDESVYMYRKTKLVKMLEIGHLMDRKIIYLSTGENRKVLIARALMQAPKLLILEDPCGGLDEQSRKTLLTHIDNLIEDESGPTIVVVAPRLDEIPAGIENFAIVRNHAIIHKILKNQNTNITADETINTVVEHKKINQIFPKPIHKNWDNFIQTDTLTPLISIKNTMVKYGTKTILDNFNWRVNAGENWAIIGPNGSGKSTLISLIRRDCPQCYSNEIRVFGKKHGESGSIWDLRHRIGFVCAESHTFHPSILDCRRVVLSGLYGSIGLHKSPTKREVKQAEQWMKCLSVDKVADTLFGELSLMEKRLILIARALIKDPILLLLDEVCQSLPADARTTVLSVLEELCHHKPPLSIICVAHHQDELPSTLDHTLYM